MAQRWAPWAIQRWGEMPIICNFPHGSACGSAGEESACSAGDPNSIPGSGRAPGEGIGYPLQYSWAALVVQLGKNLPAMQEIQETQIWSLGQEDPLGEGMATNFSSLAWRIPCTEEPGGIRPIGSQSVGHDSGGLADTPVIPTQALEHSVYQGKWGPPGASADTWPIV